MPLPRSLRPVAGEWFASYIDRMAHHLDVPLITLLKRVGITSTERMSDVPAGYGAYLAPEALTAFARATHLTTHKQGDCFWSGTTMSASTSARSTGAR